MSTARLYYLGRHAVAGSIWSERQDHVKIEFHLIAALAHGNIAIRLLYYHIHGRVRITDGLLGRRAQYVYSETRQLT